MLIDTEDRKNIEKLVAGNVRNAVAWVSQDNDGYTVHYGDCAIRTDSEDMARFLARFNPSLVEKLLHAATKMAIDLDTLRLENIMLKHSLEQKQGLNLFL